MYKERVMSKHIFFYLEFFPQKESLNQYRYFEGQVKLSLCSIWCLLEQCFQYLFLFLLLFYILEKERAGVIEMIFVKTIQR